MSVSAQIVKITTGEEVNYRRIESVVDQPISGETKDDMFGLFLREFINRNKYLSGLSYRFENDSTQDEYDKWISNIGNYAKNGGDMW